MEGEQRVKVEDEEAIIIATADTQLIAETTASMETEESLELHQDDSVRDPSFNEGNFMSHNLLTSASTPICPASAMKRLLHLSNDSSEDNRTPPKKLRTELISKEAVQEPIQDGGSDSWKSHDGRLHPPSDAHLKGGSFSLDTGADDAHHRKSDSFSPDDNGAAAASSYDSHQGHIYRTGMSSDRLLDLRKSPTKEQLVHMIENLNRKIARYETGQEDRTCPSQHKNELMENTGKKLTFAINAICVVEMKDENSALIRSVRLCEEAHPWPLSTYLGAGSFQHSGSDADRSGSAGSSSQVSGPGPFDVPPLTHAAKMAAVLHDSSSSSTNDGARAPHQGALGARLHVKLRPQQLRLGCPRCEYAFARPNQPANHSQPSSHTGSPLAGQSQLRDISNLATPPTAIKVSVSDSESLTKQSRPLLKRICKTDSDSMTLKHSAAGDILRSTPELIEPQQTLVDQNRRSSEGVADSLASDSRIRIHALQSLDNDRKLTTSKESTMTPDTSLAAKESTLTSNTSLVAKESTWTSNTSLIAKESILTSNTSLVAKDSTLTSNTSLVAKESTLTSTTSPVATESTLISNTSLVAKESTLTSDASQLAKESTLTSNTSLVAKESTMTPSKPVATKKSPVTPSTSWGGKGIGTPYLNLDTSSMSTDSDAESSIFPSIFDDPGIESPFLDMETCHVTHLDMDSDAESEKQLRLTDELPLSKSRKMVVSPSRQYQLEIELIKQGPIPEAGTNLFKGCAVLFSQCKRHIDAWRTLRASDTEDSERELRTPADNFSPMHVHRLTRQVLAGGGEVYKRLHQVPKHMKDNLYLISDGPSRSPLYLSCIMLGVPLISYTAVITACIERQNFKQLVEKHRDLFYLPVGWSDETGRKVMRKSVQEPLAGIRVGYECQPHGGNHVTHTFWREILARMGAHVFEPPTQQRLDFVVRNAPPDDQNAPAGVQNAPSVNCNWIVHSLLHASCRPADASPLYNVEFYH